MQFCLLSCVLLLTLRSSLFFWKLQFLLRSEMSKVTSLTFIMKTTIKTGILLSAYGKNFSALVPSKLLLCIMLTIRCCVQQKLFAKRKMPS